MVEGYERGQIGVVEGYESNRRGRRMIFVMILIVHFLLIRTI